MGKNQELLIDSREKMTLMNFASNILRTKNDLDKLEEIPRNMEAFFRIRGIHEAVKFRIKYGTRN